MTEQQACEAIVEAWSTGWVALHPDVPFTLDNEAFDAASAPDTWARVTIVPSLRAQGSMGPVGSQRFESKGYIAVQLFTPSDAGASTARGLCDDVRKVLERKGFVVGSETVVTFAGSTKSPTTDGRWYQVTVTVPFLYWQTA